MASEMYASVKALVEKEGKILMLKVEMDGTVFHALPGGKVEYGETPKEALVRELEEETSLDVTPDEPVGMYYFYVGARSDGDQVVVTVWDVDWDGDVCLNSVDGDGEGFVGFEWVEPEDLDDLNAAPELINLLEDLY